MKLKNLLVTNGPTIMILIIAIAAAYGGTVEAKTADNIQELRSDIKLQERFTDTLVKEAEQFVAEDIDYEIRALYYLDQAWIESWSYSIMKGSLTFDEQTERLDIIVSNIILASQWYDRTWANAIYDFFENGGSEIDVFSPEDSAIQKSDYDALENGLVTEWDFEELLIAYEMQEVADIIGYSGPATLQLTNNDVLIKLFTTPISDSADKIVDLNNKLFEEEAKQAGLRMAISVITVATILSAAMASRLRFRKTKVAFSEVRADIKNDEKLLISPGDLIASLVLGMAVLIATVGLLLAI